MIQSLVREREVQIAWMLKAFRWQNLRTEDGRRVDVLFPGFPAGEGGPDFRAARLLLDGAEREGDVEVHLTPSGWAHHGHARDASYAGVILHVALRRDSFPSATRGMAGEIPELILEPYLDVPAARLASLAPHPAEPGPPASLAALGEERVAARVRALERSSRAFGADGALYRELMVGLGYGRNKPGFAELARLVPWARVRGRDAAGARAAYADVEGSIAWRRPGRPANHPRRRLDGWARFVGSLGGAGLLETFARDPRSAEARLTTDGIGPDRARDLVVNAVVPALLAFAGPAARAAARVRLAEREPGPGNRRVREAAAALGIAVPCVAIERLGLLEWRARQ